ncbi:putative B3 domain-containing protein Os04g0347400 [Panicum virgatum]|nr:putative B3 domain-containing protein Os04g0347400 [Panicum virgatum]
MVLLRKKQDASTIGDYRPISLIHSFTKLLTKAVAFPTHCGRRSPQCRRRPPRPGTQRVLLPFTSDTLRIPDELAAEVGSDEALVVGPTGGKAKPWRVEVGWDGDGAFLGRGWPGFAAACGVAPRWLLVLRHRGHGVLSVKGFDADSCLLREHGARPPPPSAAVEATTGSQDTARKLQFLRVLLPKDFMEKMLIPAKIVQYIPKEHLDYRKAIVSGPLGKVSPIELEMNQSGVFFRGGWSQFLVLPGITEDNSLLLRYEGNMVFTVKVFEADGHQRESKHKDIGTQQVSTLPDIRERQEESSVSIQKRCNSNWLNSGGQKMQKGPITRLKKAPLWRKSVFKIGPPSWIKKEINANSLKRELALSAAFCGAIGLPEHCTITLKTSMSSTESWQVLALPSKKGSYQLRNGWMRFCKENSLKIGDICTFNVIEMCYSDNRSNSRANTCNKPRLPGGAHLLDKRLTRALLADQMIHDNSTDRTALVPATHHSNFCPINFRW